MNWRLGIVGMLGAWSVMAASWAVEPPKFETAAGDFREGVPMWHIQGMAVGEDAVYMCEGKALFKFDMCLRR